MKKALRSDRIFELDFLRGLALVMMCLDHLVYDLSCLPDWFPDRESKALYALAEWGWKISLSDWRLSLHYLFATLFLLLAGTGAFLTRHPLRRTGQIALGALTITGATVLLDLCFDMDTAIVFGVLSVMAVGAFLCWICSLLGKRWGKWIALAAGITAVWIGFSIRWYETYSLYTFYWDLFPEIALGTLRYGADWFPVFPCAGVILIGYFLGAVLYKDRRSRIPFLRGKADPVFCRIGRFPLWIYLLHQPVLMGILYAVVFLFARA